jgi:hypothetical protein
VPAPKRDSSRQPSNTPSGYQVGDQTSEPIQFVEVHPVHSAPPQNHAAVETRIDVIRMKEQSSAQAAGAAPEASDVDQTNPNQPMDEALNYLLRQLRDSQSRNAA